MELYTLNTWHIIIGYVLLFLGIAILIFGTVYEERAQFLIGAVVLLIYFALSIIIIIKYKIPLFLGKEPTFIDLMSLFYIGIGILMIFVSIGVLTNRKGWSGRLKGWSKFLLVLFVVYFLLSIGSFIVLII